MWNKTSTVCIMLAIVIVLVLFFGAKAMKSDKATASSKAAASSDAPQTTESDKPASFRGRK